MSSQEDLTFVQRVLGGDDAAAAELRSRYHGRLVAVLCARGASKTEAEDLVADLWADCFLAPGAGRPLLAKFQGRCALESWLMTVAMHRLVDLKRRQSFRVSVATEDDSAEDFFDRRPQPERATTEEPLLHLLEQATRHAFAKADAEGVLMLKLVHLHRVTQREVARMWGWHESKVSRLLDATRAAVAADILREVKRTDPWIELRWEDFIELCERSTELFPNGHATEFAKQTNS